MTQRNPDLAAGVYVALSAGVVLLCLVGALVLPASLSLNKWLGVVALAGALVGAPMLDRLAHRSRIREAVRELGGTVVHIRRLPFWQQPSNWYLPGWIKHRVDYADRWGLTHHAHCRSCWFHAVEWLKDNVRNPEQTYAPP
jgi:hypothetical protein